MLRKLYDWVFSLARSRHATPALAVVSFAESSVFPVPPTDPMPEEWLDAYFASPAPTKGWDYSKVPDACAAQ